MNKRIVFCIGIFIVLGFSSCGKVVSRNQTPIPLPTLEPNSATQVATLTINAIKTQAWTETPIPIPIKTLLPSPVTPAPSPQYIEDSNKIPECSGGGMPRHPEEGFGLPGTIVYLNNRGSLYAIGGVPIRQVPLVTEEGMNDVFGFSPDGKWLAYSLEKKGTDLAQSPTRTITLLSNTGEKIVQSLNITELQGEIGNDERIDGFNDNLSYWINNNLLYSVLDTAKMNSSGPITSHYLVTLIDPFDGVWENSTLKGLQNWSPYWISEDNSAGLSPDLSRVVYMTESGLVLKNLDDKSDIWFETSYIDKLYSGILIRWNPAGTAVVIATWNRLGDQTPPLVMSRDGKEQRLIGDEEFPSRDGIDFVRALSWSPDGEKLALVGQAKLGNSKYPYLYIYDMLKNQYVYRCPIVREEGDLPQNIFWSPDGDYIAYAFLEHPEGDPLQVLSLKNGELLELAQDAYIVGWSGDFSVEWPR